MKNELLKLAYQINLEVELFEDADGTPHYESSNDVEFYFKAEQIKEYYGESTHDFKQAMKEVKQRIYETNKYDSALEMFDNE